MKKYIPNPVRESLKFKPEVEVNKSSTAQNKNWVFPSRNVRVAAAGAQQIYADDNHQTGQVEQRAKGTGTIINGNHPRSGAIASDAEALAKLS